MAVTLLDLTHMRKAAVQVTAVRSVLPNKDGYGDCGQHQSHFLCLTSVRNLCLTRPFFDLPHLTSIGDWLPAVSSWAQVRDWQFFAPAPPQVPIEAGQIKELFSLL